MQRDDLAEAATGGTIVGIEGGGTGSVAVLLAEGATAASARRTGPPLNARLLDDASAEDVLRAFAADPAWAAARTVGICLAGVRTARDAERIAQLARRVWPRAAIRVSHDMISALVAGAGEPRGVLVLCGTGSNVYGRDARDREVRAGGWGHLLGDAGSGYWIAMAGLRRALRHIDLTGSMHPLGVEFLRALLLNDPEELVPWVHRVQKGEVAALAPQVFAVARRGDADAQAIIGEAAADLAARACRLIERLDWAGVPPVVVLAGGVFRRQPAFVEAVTAGIRSGASVGEVRLLTCDGALGAAFWAGAVAAGGPRPEPRAQRAAPADAAERGLADALTEQRNPRSATLDRLSIGEAFDLMSGEDEQVVPAVRAERESIIAGIERVVASFRAGGRLFYVGAGTSGRLGIVDASECPPTFSTDPAMVQGIIAGGVQAIWRAQEGAEDDPAAGAAAIAARGVDARDTVCGIATSGSTPFVWGALAEARRRGAATLFLTCNPRLRARLTQIADVVICTATGAELITGSTRLKAGTATKLVLNMLTTLAMVQIGKVYRNLMVDLTPACYKLEDRSARILMLLLACDRATAERWLAAAGGRLKLAIVMARHGLSQSEAEARLAAAGGIVAAALGERPAPGA